MKIFTNKSIWKKIAIALVIIILFEFIISSPVRADDDGVGGKLMEPILSLVTALGDGIVHLTHESVMGQDQSLIRVDMKETIWDHIGGIVIGILAGIAAIALIVVTCRSSRICCSCSRYYCYRFNWCINDNCRSRSWICSWNMV